MTTMFTTLANHSCSIAYHERGFLCLIEDTNQCSIPLLQSTEELLNFLHCPSATDDQNGATNTCLGHDCIGLNRSHNQEEVNGIGNSNDDITTELVENANDAAEPVELPEPLPDADVPATSTPLTGKDHSDPSTRFIRVKGSIEYIIRSLNHIESFHEEDRSSDKRKSKSARRARQLISLENHRQMLQQKKAEDTHSTDNDSTNDHDNRLQLAPWVRMIRTLNSLAAIMDVLVPIFDHPKCQDMSLTLHGLRLTEGQSWFLGQHVYDIYKKKTFNKIRRRLENVFDNIVSKGNIRNDWKWPWRKELDEMMQSLASSFTGGLHLAASVPSYCKEGKISPNRAIFSVLDEAMGLVNGSQDTEHMLLYKRSVNRLYEHLSKLLDKAYPNCSLSIYGSCLSDLSLGKSSDVDISIYISQAQRSKDDFESGRISADKYEKARKQFVLTVCRQIEHRSYEFRDVQPVTRARVPLVRGTYLRADNPYTENGSIDFDICFLNDIAVVNSSLLREYSLVDPRVKSLMMAVKRWAKFYNVCSAKEHTWSSYTWMILVVFYLQKIGLVPNFQDQKLMDQIGQYPDKSNDRWHNINNLNTFFLKWKDVSAVWKQAETAASISVVELLHGFFHFYAHGFPRNIFLISIRTSPHVALPKTAFPFCSSPFVIEDPFETFDSHCPHDLGGHANEGGIRKILRCLDQAEKLLRGLLDRAVNGKKFGSHIPWLPPPAAINKDKLIPSTEGDQSRSRDVLEAIDNHQIIENALMDSVTGKEATAFEESTIFSRDNSHLMEVMEENERARIELGTPKALRKIGTGQRYKQSNSTGKITKATKQKNSISDHKGSARDRNKQERNARQNEQNPDKGKHRVLDVDKSDSGTNTPVPKVRQHKHSGPDKPPGEKITPANTKPRNRRGKQQTNNAANSSTLTKSIHSTPTQPMQKESEHVSIPRGHGKNKAPRRFKLRDKDKQAPHVPGTEQIHHNPTEGSS